MTLFAYNDVPAHLPSSQSFLTHLTSEPPHDYQFKVHDKSPFSSDTSRSSAQTSERCISNAHIIQGNTSADIAKQPTSTSETRDAATKIGSILSNGIFVCDNKNCAGLTFARQAELRRHFTTLHATNKPEFWCQVPFCQRSMKTGGQPFRRKDKLKPHIRSMHSGIEGGSCL